jgi:hypothetical protein
MHRLLGISANHATALLRDRYPLPSRHALTLADDLERTFAGVPELIAELRAYAKARAAAIGKRLPRAKKVTSASDPLA